MRVLRLFLQVLVLVVVAAVCVYFLGGLIILQVVPSTFRADVAKLVRFSQNSDQYMKACQLAPGASVNSIPLAFQLRFTSDTEYVIEVICSLIPQAPVNLGDGRLPMLVQKAPGSSGFYISLDEKLEKQTSTVKLTALNKAKQFTLNGPTLVEGKLESRWNGSLPSPVPRPQTSCEGYGLKCCHPYAEKGSGMHISDGVLDCAATCHATCTSIPYVQAFSSEPYAAEDQTIVMSGTSQQVLYSYSVVSDISPLESVTIDYGDGQTEKSTQMAGIFTHVYTCTDSCRYKVSLQVRDTKGRQSVENDTATFYIVHTP